MIFDTVDFEFLKLTGFSRYMPTGLQRRYDTPMLSRNVISNLQEHKLVKIQNDGLSIKLTAKGIQRLAEIGYSFPKDARMNIKRRSYKRKLKNAELNILLYLAGTDIFYKTAKDLAGIEKGYMSSLAMRSDKNMKVLAGTRFLGILKLKNIAYVLYHIENECDWIFPGYEKEIYSSQIHAIGNIKGTKLILTGEALEELWSYTHFKTKSTELKNGRKAFFNALEELGSEYLLVPFGRDGVIQLSVITIYRYKERIAKAIGCNVSQIDLNCDGVIDNIPYIIAVDFNVKRIVRLLRQIERYNEKITPRICCLPFQKKTMFKLLKEYNAQKTVIITIDKNNLYNIFPELSENILKREPFVTKEGEYIEVAERKANADQNKAFED